MLIVLVSVGTVLAAFVQQFREGVTPLRPHVPLQIPRYIMNVVTIETEKYNDHEIIKK
jgi:hypothetical protein